MIQKTKTLQTLVPTMLVAAAVAGSYGGHVHAASFSEAVASGDTGLELRYRFESVEQAGISNKAQASTLRTRLNYTSGQYGDFSAFIEFDDITAFGDIKYNDATGLATAQTSYPVVADPEGSEVNQANISYTGLIGTTVRLGRQRVIFDNARFIGNVGWRQNEQTYDALTVVSQPLSDTTVVYGYVSNVNRIFGEASPKGDIDTKTHLLNVAYTGFKAGKLVGYGYFLDLIDSPAASNATIGARFKGATQLNDGVKALYTLEFATQSDYKQGASNIDADYSLLELGAEFGGVTVKASVETLGKGGSAFSTPLATAHAFNGWADKFLTTPTEGLKDTYITVGGKVAGVKLLAVFHDYSAGQGGASYGDEINLLAVKKFGKHYKGLIKYASYSADSYATDTDKVWLMGQANF